MNNRTRWITVFKLCKKHRHRGKKNKHRSMQVNSL